MQFTNPASTKNESQNMTTRHLRKSIGRSPLRLALLLIPLALTYFALSPIARAQLSPPPDGGYAARNTAEGDNALFSLTTGRTTRLSVFKRSLATRPAASTPPPVQALANNTTGTSNTATGLTRFLTTPPAAATRPVGYRALEQYHR